ncbi:hypothetical protein E2320_001944 [Naja naja]|nr:hypothetical protein E2320_001944 [Naja naja]
MATALLSPQAVKAVTWEKLQEVLGNHYAPKPSRIAHHHAFQRRSQAEGESVSEYMAALGLTALQCSFRDQLDNMLLDQLIYGVRDLRLQRRLLAKANLSLKQAIEEVQAAELSTLSAAVIQKSNSLPRMKPSSTVHYEDTYFEDDYFEEEEAVNHLKTPQSMQRRSLPADKIQLTPQLICLSCGGNHLRATCHFRNSVCLKCQKKEVLPVEAAPSTAEAYSPSRKSVPLTSKVLLQSTEVPQEEEPTPPLWKAPVQQQVLLYCRLQQD